MMIPKEQLTGEDVRQVVEQMIRDHLNVAVDGYKCDTTVVVNVLVKAAIEGQTIESVSEDLAGGREQHGARALECSAGRV